MVDGFIYAFPLAQVWHVGLYRDQKTLVPVEYYNRFSLESSLRQVYVLDSTLSCGAVDTSAVGLVKEWGVPKIKLCVVVASPEGIKAFHEVMLDACAQFCTLLFVLSCTQVYMCVCACIYICIFVFALL